MHYAQNKRGTKQGQNYMRICSSNGLYFVVAPPPYASKTACTPLGGFPIRQWDRLQDTQSCWNRKVFPRRLQQIWKNRVWLQLHSAAQESIVSSSKPPESQWDSNINSKTWKQPVDAPHFTATTDIQKTQPKKNLLEMNRIFFLR